MDNNQKTCVQISIIRRKELLKILQISRTTLWRLEKNQSEFPTRIKLSERIIGYSRSEVMAWIASRERVVQPLESEGGSRDE